MMAATEKVRTQNNHYQMIDRAESGLAPVAPLRSHAAPYLPVVTYRIQFNRSFTFDDARRRVSYLHMLGVTDCYASPYFKARADSSHGYDIADHNALNPAIGDEALYAAFVAELHARGMGQVLDIVPNHMGIGERGNGWWMDVLENGPSSLYAPFFDIDWHPIKPELENKVLLPILGQQYGRVLENSELNLRYEDGAFFLYYYQHELPINPRTYTEILAVPLDQLIEMLGPEHEQVLEYQSIMTALGHLPPRTETDRAKVIERHREKEIIKRRLATLCSVSPEVRDVIEATVRRFNGIAGDPRSFDLLDALVDRQAYRPSSWRVAAEEINYRRFFDINDLAAIRIEHSEVFEATHRLIVQLLAEGNVNGLRIDHPDGLWDPAGYFRRLQECYAQILDDRRPTTDDRRPTNDQRPTTNDQRQGDKQTSRQADKQTEQSAIYDLQSAISQSNGQPTGTIYRAPTDNGQLYIVVEKILGRGERLPSDWAVHGSTGYEFLNTLNGIFVDGSTEKRFTELYASFTGQRLRFEDLVYESKKQIMRIAMASELNVLAYQLNRISERNRYYRDFTLNSLRDVLREAIACFPVYRTYIVADSDQVEERDRTNIETAIARAKRRNPTVDPSIYDFLRNILLLEYPDTLDPEARDEQRTFVMKFQQITGPVVAKGLEDTAFYIYNRLASLNEVGGDPQRFGTPLAEFHRQNQERQRHWPASMLATSTHDTKRAEDVRARINVLSELPDAWRTALSRWSRLNRSKKIEVDGRLAPDRNEEYLLYQTLLGAWPFESTNDQRPTTNDRRQGDKQTSRQADGESETQNSTLNTQNFSSLLPPPSSKPSSEFVERIQNYMIKAIREAKVNTSWLNPNTAYDEAVRSFVAAVLDGASNNRFLGDFDILRQKVAHFGAFNALSQVLLKLAAPGVPDIYQGNEIWDFSLVDPDNRRPVDYDLRARLLNELIAMQGDRAALVRRLVDAKEDGRIKLYLTHRAMTFRRDHADLFRAGDYTPLAATDDANEHIVAFARTLGDQQVLAVAPRLLAKRLRTVDQLPLGEGAWADALLMLPARRSYRNIFTDEVITAIVRDQVVGLPLAEVFANFPVALLERVTG